MIGVAPVPEGACASAGMRLTTVKQVANPASMRIRGDGYDMDNA
jgi:hypothetical protein